MTGKEAWDLISPYISPLDHEEFRTKEMSAAFITTYIALKEHDERISTLANDAGKQDAEVSQ